MSKKKTKPLPPDGWLIRSEISSSGSGCVEIVPPSHSECLTFMQPETAREFAMAIIRECDHLEGIK